MSKPFGIVDQYRARWHIEQLFRLLKKKGFVIESSELESGWAI
jgi:transposase